MDLLTQAGDSTTWKTNFVPDVFPFLRSSNPCGTSSSPFLTVIGAGRTPALMSSGMRFSYSSAAHFLTLGSNVALYTSA